MPHAYYQTLSALAWSRSGEAKVSIAVSRRCDCGRGVAVVIVIAHVMLVLGSGALVATAVAIAAAISCGQWGSGGWSLSRCIDNGVEDVECRKRGYVHTRVSEDGVGAEYYTPSVLIHQYAIYATATVIITAIATPLMAWSSCEGSEQIHGGGQGGGLANYQSGSQSEPSNLVLAVPSAIVLTYFPVPCQQRPRYWKDYGVKVFSGGTLADFEAFQGASGTRLDASSSSFSSSASAP
ncbi:hypothetical protein EI94DRAFT_1706130 [Lactarius quietus]|nr:hypothetical protein EI94DRAFT_1706130 [Lactarius quietus]